MKKAHFVGVGGIGVSALARYYLKKGWRVSGSDLSSSEITEDLRNQGVKIFIGKHKARNLPSGTNLIIYSPAVKSDNPELKKAYKLQTTNYKLQILSYPQAIGELTKKYFTIAISGTHGKSTTTAMIGLIFKKAGLDPTVIVGTKIREFKNSNCLVGKSKYLVIEADEWQASFLNYWPRIIVLTNIEMEHLDFYKDLNHILRTYREYIGHLPRGGALVANGDDENIRQALISNSQFLISKQIPNIKFQIKRCFLKQPEVKKLEKILKVPGKHNICNALAALTVARILKISDRVSLQTLSEYRGAWRRFETKEYKIPDTKYKIPIISDYAHHPTEIKATIKAAREKFKERKIWVIFQPHQYQRTHYLFNEFTSAFDSADEIILTDIFDVAGREEKKITEKVSSKKLAKAIGKRRLKVHFIGNFRRIPQFLIKRLKLNDVVLIMGAGDIYKLVELL
jgi:UDP-N-acetylmuramate--alanine ligase